MAKSLGEIFISLGLSTASFTANLEKAKNLAFGNAREIERSFKLMGGVVTGALGTAAASLVAMTKSAINNADHMGKLAQSTGMSVEKFSAFAYAAGRSDVETETLAKSLTILAKNLEKSNQQTLEGKAAHTALGTLYKGQIPAFANTADAFQQISAKLAKLPDGYQKTALAAQIFGKSGAALIPMMKDLDEVTQRAEKLGLIVGTQTARRAEEFNDRLKDMGLQTTALGMGIASELLPKLNELAKAFEAANAAQLGQKTGHFLAKMVNDAQWGFAIMEQIQLKMSIASAKMMGLDTGESEALLKGFQERVKELSQEDLRLRGIIPGVNEELKETAKATADAGEASAEARKKIDALVQSLRDEIWAKTHDVIQTNLYKAEQLGANAADMEAVKILSQKLKLMQEFAKGPAKALPKAEDPFGKFLNPPPKLGEGLLDLPLPQTFGSLQEGLDSMGNLGMAIREAQKPLTDFQKGVVELKKDLRLVGQNGVAAFADILVMGGNMRQFFASLLQQVASLMLQFLILRPMLSSFGLGFLFAANGAVIPARAGGGPVFGRGPFLVGEQGPELFVPPPSGGMIVPNNRLPNFSGGFGGGGVTVVQNIDNRGADIGTTTKVAALLNRLAIEQYHRMRLDMATRTA